MAASREIEKQRLLAAALNKLQSLKKTECFDGNDLESRPTKEQHAIIDAVRTQIASVVSVRGGNQCLSKGTLVATPRGAVPIEDIKVGDTVYSENGLPIKVLQTFANGTKPVYNLVNRGKVWARATAEHVWQRGQFKPKSSKFLHFIETSTTAYDESTPIRRTFVQAPMGSKAPRHPYALGALLGDGCSRERRLSISGKEGVPQKVAQLLNGTAIHQHAQNYTWHLQGCEEPDFYAEWCKGRYAHEKVVDLEEIKTWNRDSLVQLFAGVLDTDGSLSGSETAKTVVLSVSMQAESVLKALEWIAASLWQVQMSWHLDDRAKYVNAPVWSLICKNPHDIKRMYSELQPHLVSEQKHWKPIYDSYGKRSRANFVSLRPEPAGEVETYDIHVDSDTNLYLLANGLVTHNSGKSQIGARIFSWLLEGTFPEWLAPPKWNKEIQLLILGRSFKQLEDSLWRKIEALLTPGTYKVVRQGGVISKVLHDNGNSLLFFSHDNVNLARERIQSFTAEAVWLDELPRSVKLIEELQRRIQAKDGFLLMTYTPKAPAPDIKRFVETMTPPVGIEYRLTALANPVYSAADKKKLIDSLSSFSEAYRATILQGEWLQPEEMVYQFQYDTMVQAPPDYSPAWRHVVSVDPASSGSTGLCVAAEHPSTGWWYLIRAEYVNIKVPTELVAEVERRIENIHVVRRVYDPHEAWYAATASQEGISYVAPYKKHERKKELIKNLQQALGTRLFVAPWCQDFIDEVTSCHYSDEFSDKIAKAQRFHVLDSAQYLVDLLPKYEHGKPQQSFWVELRQANERRKQAEEAVRSGRSKPYTPARVRRRSRIW